MVSTPPQATHSEDAQSELMTRDRWLQRLGFQFNPFEYEAADELEDGDPHLDEYFVLFPYFDELKNARSSVLFTQRGCGKSANRLQLERWCEKTLENPKLSPENLAVRHDDFLTILTDISLTRHVEAILRRAVPGLLEAWFRHFPGAVDNLSAKAREDLSWFVQNYSDRLIPSGLQQQLRKVGSARHRKIKKKTWQGLVDSVGSLFKKEPIKAIEQATKTLIELFSWEFRETEAANWLRSEPLELVRRFVDVAHEIGIKHVFVLVDRVDEFQGTASESERQAELLRPLLANIPTRGLLCFKFFLPLKLLPVLRKKLGPDEFREDKTQILEVEWKPEDITQLLERRLFIASKGQRSRFVTLITGGLSADPKIDNQLVEFAHHSPRDLVRLCDRIFSEHTRVPTKELYLEPDEIQAAKRWFAKTRARELYGDEWLAQLIRLSEMPFPAAAVSQALDLTEEKTESLLHDWQEKGLVKRQSRDPAQPEAASLFDIADPRARLVWEEEHL